MTETTEKSIKDTKKAVDKMVKVRFNTLMIVMEWSESQNKMVAANNDLDIRARLSDLSSEHVEGDLELTARYRRLRTSTFTISQALSEVMRDSNGLEIKTHYHAGEIVSLPEKEAEYYLTFALGGTYLTPKLSEDGKKFLKPEIKQVKKN